MCGASDAAKLVRVGKIELIVTEPELVMPFFIYDTVAVRGPTPETADTAVDRSVTEEELLPVMIEHAVVGVHVQLKVPPSNTPGRGDAFKATSAPVRAFCVVPFR